MSEPDPLEKLLQEMADRLQTLWREAQDETSPLGELAALARATLVYYQERERASDRRSVGEQYPS